MKKVMLVVLIILFSAGSGFCGEFEDTLKKAEHGNAEAQYNLGIMYDFGQGVPQDYKQAFYWYTKAAEQGHVKAQHNLGVMYEKGEGVNQNYKQAVIWLTQAAKQGSDRSQYNLGLMYAKGRGVPQDDKQAVIWLTEAAKQGHALAQANLGLMYYNGHGVLQDYKQALYWYKKSAEQGYAKAQYNLGWIYNNGRGVLQNYKQAVHWYTKAAEQGHAKAQANLGQMYEKGQGVAQDYKLASYWYTKAAEQGHAKAQANLGTICFNGQGVPQDHKQAIFWWTKAAEQGDALAQFNLGLMYYNGRGVPQDYKQAYVWWDLAAAQGFEPASKNRNIITKELTPHQFSEAQNQAAKLSRISRVAHQSVENYRIPLYKGKIHLPKWISKGGEDDWKDDLGKSVSEPKINFAGKYFIESHSCGTMCSYYTLTDLSTGQDLDLLQMFHNGESRIVNQEEIYKYHTDLFTEPDSNILTARECALSWEGDVLNCEESVFLFKGEKLKLISTHDYLEDHINENPKRKKPANTSSPKHESKIRKAEENQKKSIKELDFGKHQNTNRLVWSESFDSFVKEYFGDRPGDFFWKDSSLVENVFAALGGPPNDIEKMDENIILASACRHRSCSEKGAIIVNTKNRDAIFALIHFRCANTKKFDVCINSPRTTVFYKDKEFLETNIAHIKRWSNRVSGETAFNFVEIGD